MTLRIKYRKNKRLVETSTWAVSCFDDPIDIMLYDRKTMGRLMKKLYKGSRAKDRRITIEEVVDKKVVGISQLTLDEQKRPDSSGG